MKLFRTALCVAAFGACAAAQVVSFGFPAGSPEDQASDSIAKENDLQKKLALLNDFVQKFSSNPVAVAYGQWQIAQAYQAAGDLKAARAAGDRALAAEPNAMDVLVALVNISQQAKDNAATVMYATKAAAAYGSIALQPKPEAVSAADFESMVKGQQASAQSAYDFVQGAAFNAIVAEQAPEARVKMAQEFSAAFPASSYSAAVAQYAIMSLLQSSDFAGLSTYGEQAIKDNPQNSALLLMVSQGYSQDQKSSAHLERAAVYAKKVTVLAQADSSLSPEQKNATIGAAKSVIGWSLLRQDKAAAAIPELKDAAPMLKSSPDDYSSVLYGLAFAYARLNRLPEAKAVLAEAVNVTGPYQELSRELLQKVNSAKPAPARKQ
ncbi:MAG: tetratricopeptide repeat protein [Acidobacteria bacterium]|nr:tetratricopeptide repeat protein [Acidobacteriota bacterium]